MPSYGPSATFDAAPPDQGPRPVFLALGTNLPFGTLAGPPLLRAALSWLEAREIRTRALSGFWESPAWPPSEQPPFVNAVAEIDVNEMGAQGLLARLSETEGAFGRVRRERWEARTLDLDIIDFKGEIVNDDDLNLPHPRAHERIFVLAPLAELAPGWRHPVMGLTAAELLARLMERDGDAQQVRRLDERAE